MAKTELDVLRDVSQRLDAAGVAFMLKGSVAMSCYAPPRMTRGIDLVIEVTMSGSRRSCACLKKGAWLEFLHFPI